MELRDRSGGDAEDVQRGAVQSAHYEILIEPDWRIVNGDDAKASFIVRQVFDPVDGRQEWRLVRWRDLGFGRQFGDDSAYSITEKRTWGQIKALYY